jgi:hypothetical protein
VIEGSVRNVLADVGSGSPIPISREVGILAVAIPIGYVIVRILYVAYTETREPLGAGGAAR